MCSIRRPLPAEAARKQTRSCGRGCSTALSGCRTAQTRRFINFYWRSNDKYEGKDTTTGPAASGFEDLVKMKRARLVSSCKVRKTDGQFWVDVTLRNVSNSIAFFNQLQFLDQNLSPVRPSFYTDNFFSLMPGESKLVTIETADQNLKNTPVLVIKGWNIERKQINLEK